MLKDFKRYIKWRKEIEHQKRVRFAERVNAEYEGFRRKILSGTKEEVYENAFRIYFYRELADYLTAECYLHYLDDLLLENTNPVAALWLYYIKTGWTSIDTEDAIDQLIEDFCEEERSVA